MGKKLFERAEVGVTCPSCGKKIRRALGRLSREVDVTCPDCGTAFKVEQAGTILDKVQKPLDDFIRRLKGFKRR